MKELLHCGADVNASSTMGDSRCAVTGLEAASSAGHTSIVKLLLENNANPNTWGDSRTTPLLIASDGLESDIVKLLVEAKAEVNVSGGADILEQEAEKSTPLVNAASFLPKKTL